MKLQTLFALAPVMLLAACADTLHMTPIQGPVAQQNPVPIIAGAVQKMDISFSTPSAESCQGRLTAVAPEQSASDLAPIWDTAYGAKYYAENVNHTKSEHYTAAVTCNKGTTMELETYQNREQIFQGIAKDSSGNVYKVRMP
jgi:hypothetical protein